MRTTLAAGAPRALAAAFGLSGVTHLIRPRTFDTVMPRLLPRSTHLPLIYVSGLAEVVLAAGLVRHRSWARWPSVLLLLVVFPANVQTAVDAGTGTSPGLADNKVVAWGRLPLQGLLIWAALQ